MLSSLGDVGDFVGGIAVLTTLAYLAVNMHLIASEVSEAYESGALGLENQAPYRDWVSANLSTPGSMVWWNEVKGSYNAALVESVGERLAERLPDVLKFGFCALGKAGEAGRSGFHSDVRELIDARLLDRENPRVPLAELWSWFGGDTWARKA